MDQQIKEQFRDIAKNTKMKRKGSFWPKFKERVKKWNWRLIMLVGAFVVLVIPQVGEAIWEIVVLKRMDPLVIYRLSDAWLFAILVAMFILTGKQQDLIDKVMDLANAQDAQIAMLKKMVESKIVGLGGVGIMKRDLDKMVDDILDEKEDPDDKGGNLKN